MVEEDQNFNKRLNDRTGNDESPTSKKRKTLGLQRVLVSETEGSFFKQHTK